jgi:hypothetical protein
METRPANLLTAMRRPALMGLTALSALLFAGSAGASSAPLHLSTVDSGPSNPANARPLSALAVVSAPQIPRPPIPIAVKNLFKSKPPPVPRWRPPVPRPSVFLPRSVPRAALSSDVIALRNARFTTDARKALRRIFNRDRYEKFSVYAFCWGVDQLADHWNDPNAYFSERTWASILYDSLRSNVENYSVPKAIQVVNGWLNVWNMAQIDPRLAYFYFRACYG